MDGSLFSQPTSLSISFRLRALRLARGLSLMDIEKATHGRFNAATLGSYERSDRSLSIARAIELANFYQIPLAHLVDEPSAPEKSAPTQLVFDLRNIRLATEASTYKSALINFLSFIAKQRSDWNGEVLSVRSADLSTLALMLQISETELLASLEEKRFLLKKLQS
ncbi:MAG: helix-turn-helix transcriptional regulator [Actinobacteria bacterium]|nr:helix-turn-helix transcriptional regulator [Actinomycetota bacterium]